VPALGPRHHRVRRLRELIRDPRARRDEGAFVVEGPRIVEAAIDRGATFESAYVAPGAERAFSALTERLRGLGVPIEELKEGVLERIGDTVTPQPVLAVAATPGTDLDDVRADGLVLVGLPLRSVNGGDNDLPPVPDDTLIVAAEHDQFGTAAELRERFPKARIAEVRGADHFFVGHRDEMARLVTEELARTLG